MKQLIILLTLFISLSSTAQNRLFGNGFYNIRNNSFGWLGTSGTDSLGVIDSTRIRWHKPVRPGVYTTSGAPDAAQFPGSIIYNTDSLKHQYSNGTSWLNLPGTGGGGGGSGTVTSVSGTDGSGFDFTVTNASTTPAIALTTSLTTGSVPFIGASGALSQDNSNLFWDASNIRFGIGTATPAERLHVYRDANALALMQFQNPNTGNTSGAGIKLSNAAGDSYIYRTSAAYATSGLADATVFQENGGGPFIWYTANQKMILTNAGSLGIGLGTGSPSNMLDILHASQPQLRLTTTATTSYTTLQGSGGNLYLNGNSVTNTLIALGGTTSSFPGIQRNAANTRSRLADNSANTDHEVADEAYDATAWNGSVEVPTKNAVRDKIESMSSGTGDIVIVNDADHTVLSTQSAVRYQNDITASRTVTLPDPGGVTGREIWVKWNTIDGGFSLSITTVSGTALIYLDGTVGLTSQASNVSFLSMLLKSDGTSWYKIN